MSNTVEVKIINKSNNPLPEYATVASAGADVRADLSDRKKVKVFAGDITFLENGGIELSPLARVMIPTGLFIELPVGYEAQMRSRSGKSLKEGLTVVQGVGTIDADYRGEMGVCLVNLDPKPQRVKDGERIAQLVIAKHEKAVWKGSEELTVTDRGEGGFGHSGKH